MKLKDMILAAVFAALTAILSQISIPLSFSPVPMTLQTLAVMLAGAILGAKRGTVALIVYTLLGAAGLPVFSQARGGFAVLAGPTGGYILGFIIAAAIIGTIVGSGSESYLKTLLAMVLGLVAVYTVGTFQLKLVLGLTIDKAIAAGVIPYIPLEIMKIVFGAYIANKVRRAVLDVHPEYLS